MLSYCFIIAFLNWKDSRVSDTFILPDDFEHFCGLRGEASLPEKMPQSAPLTKGEDGVKRYLGNAQIDLALFIQNPLTLPKWRHSVISSFHHLEWPIEQTIQP